jgi:hypothetical protein
MVSCEDGPTFILGGQMSDRRLFVVGGIAIQGWVGQNAQTESRCIAAPPSRGGRCGLVWCVSVIRYIDLAVHEARGVPRCWSVSNRILYASGVGVPSARIPAVDDRSGPPPHRGS